MKREEYEVKLAADRGLLAQACSWARFEAALQELMRQKQVAAAGCVYYSAPSQPSVRRFWGGKIATTV